MVSLAVENADLFDLAPDAETHDVGCSASFAARTGVLQPANQDPQRGCTAYGCDFTETCLETGLMYARSRMYSPTLGRFISTDTLKYINGLNLYRAYFAPGSLDPSGLVTPPPPGQTAGDGKGGEILGFSEGSVLWGQVSKGTTWWGKEITYRAYEEMQNEYMWGPDKSMIETSITGPIRTDCSPCKSCMRTCWYVYQVELKKTAYMDVYQKYTYGIINQTLEKYYDFVTGYYGTVPIGGVMTVGGGLVAAGLEAGAATGVTVGATGWAVYTIMTKEMQEHFHSERTVLGTGWKYLGQDKGYSKSLSKTEMKGESWAEKCP